MGDQNQPLNAAAPSNPGAVLLQARTALGLSREQLAERLHMRPHQIEALECHQQERWPEAVFTIAQVRRLAAALGLDAEPVVEAFRADLSQQTNEASPAAKAVFQLGRWKRTGLAWALVLLSFLLSCSQSRWPSSRLAWAVGSERPS